MEKTLYRFIWRHSARRQMVILLLTVVSFPILYLSLELPKRIVNDAIQGTDFPREFFGFEFGQIPYLMLLCLAFLSLVVLNNVVKFTLNIYKGLTGERMLRRLRYTLYERMMRFRLPHFRKVSSGEIIPMITAEVEPLGGFIGDAIAQPAFQGGTLIVYITFIFAQDPLLGAAAISLYPIQGYIIPKLQKKVIRLQRERVKNIRKLSDGIGESVAGITDIHANATSAWHLSHLAGALYTNFQIRYDIFKRKYMIKFVNNFMNQLPPFMFYSIGGYLVINGDITFGALVAVLAAYKDLAGPWKELLDYYQNLADISVRYQTVVENFDPPDLMPRERLGIADEAVSGLEGDLQFSSVNLSTGIAGQELHDVSLTVAPGEGLAIVGGEGSGRPELIELACGLVEPTTGRVRVGEARLDELSETVLGRDTAYIGPSPHIFTGTVRDNLVYGLRHRPRNHITDEEDFDDVERTRRQEAERTGNIHFDIDQKWEDLSVLSIDSDHELDAIVVRLANGVGLGADIYRMGLHAFLDADENPETVAGILQMRAAFAECIGTDPDLQGLVDLWDVDRFNANAPLVENILFGAARDRAMEIDEVAADPDVLEILDEAGLRETLIGIGIDIAEVMVELFAEVSGDSDLLGADSLIPAEELPAYDTLLKRIKANGRESLKAAENRKFIGLAFRLVPARHRLGVIDDDKAASMVAGRKVFRENAERLAGRYVAFAPDAYAESLSIEDNIIFGKPRLDRRGAREEIERLIGDTADRLGLRDHIAHAGLDFEVGVAGSRLSSGQRRRLSLARALLKRPKIIAFEDVDNTLGDNVGMLQTIRERQKGAMILAGSSRLDRVAGFERILLMRNGRICADGDVETVRNAIRDLGAAEVEQ
ncbi:ABC transporter transmembrane domain-containing protein [Rhodobium gokarnense]|uniref:ABC transport system ATP-binding protein n=1 Tax=Rhodobium gokarnense TaxID=364296 RepID=A0ABT3HBT5_9HYPH|nr:ABC transporter transmembrane domain-containing protein [Rhodobium gokarnense]MCW2307851.1 putative ABC transport system ATP-binding protein [Rhodobium gokarnense]